LQFLKKRLNKVEDIAVNGLDTAGGINPTDEGKLNLGKHYGHLAEIVFFFKVIQSFSPSLGNALDSGLDGGLEEEYKIRSRGKVIAGQYILWIKAGSPLVGDGGKIITVTEDDLSRLQGRREDFLDMFFSVGQKEVKFLFLADGVTMRIEFANLSAVDPFGGLPGTQHRKSLFLQGIGEKLELGGFTSSVSSFKDDE